jgi:hypothetical protein
MNEPSVTYLRRISKAVFVACEEPVAADISNHLIWAAARIEALETALRDVIILTESEEVGSARDVIEVARAALAPEQDK